jgi:hypothetical protein
VWTLSRTSAQEELARSEVAKSIVDVWLASEFDSAGSSAENVKAIDELDSANSKSRQELRFTLKILFLTISRLTRFDATPIKRQLIDLALSVIIRPIPSGLR